MVFFDTGLSISDKWVANLRVALNFGSDGGAGIRLKTTGLLVREFFVCFVLFLVCLFGLFVCLFFSQKGVIQGEDPKKGDQTVRI